MSTYTIYFCGLIMHIGGDDGLKDSSALVIEEKHHRLLYFQGERPIPVISQEIRILGLPPLPAVPDQSFIDLVPNVKKIMGGSLETGVHDATNPKATFFIHVGGTLSAMCRYEHRVEHIRRGMNGTFVVRDGYVAKLVRLVFSATDPVKIKADGFERELTPGAVVKIANYDQDNHEDWKENPHFRKYSRITNWDNSDISMKEVAGGIPSDPYCSQVPPWVKDVVERGDGARTAAHPECGNSAWP